MQLDFRDLGWGPRGIHDLQCALKLILRSKALQVQQVETKTKQIPTPVTIPFFVAVVTDPWNNSSMAKECCPLHKFLKTKFILNGKWNMPFWK